MAQSTPKSVFAICLFAGMIAELLIFPSAIYAETAVYSSTGPSGEAQFSDQPSPDAQLLYLFTQAASAEEAERIQQRTAEHAELAAVLEQARLDRQATLSRSRFERQTNPGHLPPAIPPVTHRRIYYPTRLLPPHPSSEPTPPAVEANPPRRPFAPAFKPVEPALSH